MGVVLEVEERLGVVGCSTHLAGGFDAVVSDAPQVMPQKYFVQVHPKDIRWHVDRGWHACGLPMREASSASRVQSICNQYAINMQSIWPMCEAHQR